MKKDELFKKLEKVNVVKITAANIFGEKHTHAHRIFCGSIFIIVGVGIAEGNWLVFHFMSSAIGYILHGIGAMPMGDWMISKIRDNQEVDSKKEENV